MKKQKLHQLAKFAAVSLIGAIPFVGLSEATAQQNGIMPPIVQGTNASTAPIVQQSYSYSSDNSKPLVPALVSSAKTAPPIISGKRIGSGVATQPARMNPANNSLLGPIGSGVKQVAGRFEPSKVAPAFSPAKLPIRAQDASARSVISPPIQIEAPGALSPVSPRSMSVIPGSGLAPTQSAPVISGSLVTQGGSDMMMSQGPVVAAPNYFESAPVSDAIPMESVVSGCGDCGNAGCSSCSSGGCDGGCAGGCDSCGPGGCYNPNKINCDYGTYGSVSSARRYAYLELLYLTREDGDITNSNFNPLGEFDFNPGWRVTLGQRSDMTQGREISYFGTAGIEASQVTNNAANRLNSLFSPGGGLLNSDLSAFNGASQHIQSKETSLHNIELNRVRWGWDVLKSFVGFRYVHLDDQYQLNSTAPLRDPFGNVAPGFETGRYRIDTINHMLGAHIGAELFYDIGYRFSLSGVSKFGVYANINKVDNFLQNGGVTLLDTEDNGATLSTTYDIQLLAHYQIRQTARLRFGYNGMFLGDVATVADNFTPFVSPFTGFNGSDSDDAFIHGFTLGLEIYR